MAMISDGVVTSITIIDGGLETSSSAAALSPDVIFNGGGGKGAEATAHINTGVVKINDEDIKGGSGYIFMGPSVFFNGGGRAHGTAVISDYVHEIIVHKSGSGYREAPTVTISPATGDTTGNGAEAEANLLLDGTIGSIKITNGGSGYTSTPEVIISNASGDTTGKQNSKTTSIIFLHSTFLQIFEVLVTKY